MPKKQSVLPGNNVVGGFVVDGGGVDRPVAVRKLPELHRVVAHRRQAVAAGLPGQQHLAGLDVLLRDGGTAGGLGTSWTNTQREGGLL